MVWLAYFLLPIIIINYFSKKKTILQFHKVYFLFALFILLCGTTHFLDALMFWTPFYRLNALVRFATGVVSLFTVFHLIKILPVAFKQKTNIELEEEIKRREEAELKLNEANKGLQAFAYIASHDLQEPLRKIRTYSALLSEANEDKYDEKSKEYSSKILTSSTKMQHLIRDVLSLSTIEREADLDRVELDKVFANVIEDLEIKIKETGSQINIDKLPLVTGNEAYLTQLFVNLVNNSIKFSERKPIIDINASISEGKVKVVVADNGIGMREEDLAQIFVAFSRMHPKHKYEGSGIGLAICKKIIDLHKGNISVSSVVGEGTTFIIELPIA